MSKTPKLRFPEFSGEWEEKKLGDISNIYDGTHQTPKYTNKGIKFVSVENIDDIYKGNKYISEEEYDNNFKIKPQINDIFMTRITAGEIGATAIVDKEEKLAYYVSVALIRPDSEKVNSYFLAKYISSKYFKRELNKRIIHVAFPKKINLGDIGKCGTYLPALQEQQKIASFLSLVDKKIEKQSEKVEAIKEYKKGMMQKIFSREIRFKDDEGKEFPEWEEKKLSNITVCLDNKRKPLNSSERDKRKGTIPYYGANGIVDYIDDFIFNEELILLAEDGGNFDDYSTRPIAQLIKGKSWVNNHTHVLHCKINTTYVFYTLVHKDIRKYINGTSRAKLNKADMLEIVVQVPNIQEQQKIANFLSTIDKKLEKEEEKLEALRTWKKGLLQQMFV